MSDGVALPAGFGRKRNKAAVLFLSIFVAGSVVSGYAILGALGLALTLVLTVAVIALLVGGLYGSAAHRARSIAGEWRLATEGVQVHRGGSTARGTLLVGDDWVEFRPFGAETDATHAVRHASSDVTVVRLQSRGLPTVVDLELASGERDDFIVNARPSKIRLVLAEARFRTLRP